MGELTWKRYKSFPLNITQGKFVNILQQVATPSVEVRLRNGAGSFHARGAANCGYSMSNNGRNLLATNNRNTWSKQSPHPGV
jgi:hypothetical protein